MKVVAIDPGPEKSAWLVYDQTGNVVDFGYSHNTVVLDDLREAFHGRCGVCAIEMIACYGMAVGREVFETCVWIGRFIEAWSKPYKLVYRREVKMHLCGCSNAKDPNVRQALIDRFGPGKDAAIGKKASPGPLFGISGDCWSALAVAVTFTDLHETTHPARATAPVEAEASAGRVI